MARRNKTVPRTQKHFLESKTLPRIQKRLVLGSVLDSGKFFHGGAKNYPSNVLLKLNLRIFYISFHFLTKLAR